MEQFDFAARLLFEAFFQRLLKCVHQGYKNSRVINHRKVNWTQMKSIKKEIVEGNSFFPFKKILHIFVKNLTKQFVLHLFAF